MSDDLGLYLHGRRLLVVDDEPELREVIAEAFRLYGAEVQVAESGTQAQQMLEGSSVELVISDIRMPNGDGVALLDAVRSRNPRRPGFIFVSGFSDLSPEEGLKRGAQAFLPKPFDMDELLALAARILTQS